MTTRQETFELLRLALDHPALRCRGRRTRAQSAPGRAGAPDTDPNYVARRAWWQGVFPDHPYGRDPEGTQADMPRSLRMICGSAFMRRISQGEPHRQRRWSHQRGGAG